VTQAPCASPPESAAAPPPVGRRVLGWLAAGAFVIVFVLVWSSGFIAGTIGIRHGPELALIPWRFSTALVVLGVITLVTRAPWPREPRVYVHLLITGVLLQTVQLAGVYLGLGHGVPAGLSSLVLSLCPLIVAAASVPLFLERMTRRQWLGLGLGLSGVLISLSENVSGSGELIGYAFTILALAGFAGGTLYQKKFGQDIDLRTAITVQLIGATATAFPLAALHGGLDLPLIAPVLGSLAWLAVVNSIGSFVLLFALLRRRSGGVATSLLYLVPPATALLAAAFLGESLTISVFVGMAVSGAGVLLVMMTGRKPAGAAGAG
jgi:drug/metabolite transporter (DMT)-like permease